MTERCTITFTDGNNEVLFLDELFTPIVNQTNLHGKDRLTVNNIGLSSYRHLTRWSMGELVSQHRYGEPIERKNIECKRRLS